MVSPDEGTERSAAVERVLAYAARRLRIGAFLRELLVAGIVLIAWLMALTLLRLLVPDATSAVRALALGSAAAFVAFAIWRLRVRDTAAHAARALDRTGGLHDELTSAHWFLAQHDSSPWVSHLVHRAGETAARLDVARLVPVQVPRRTTGTLGLLLAVLVLLNLVPGAWTRSWLLADPPAAPGLTTEERARVEDVAMLLEQAQLLDAIDPETLRQLRELLDKLQTEALSVDEVLEALDDAKELLDRAQSENRDRAADAPEDSGEQPEDTPPGEPDAEAEPSDTPPGEPESRRRMAEELRKKAAEALQQLKQEVTERAEAADQASQQAEGEPDAEQQGAQAAAATPAGGQSESQQPGDAQQQPSDQGAEGGMTGDADGRMTYGPPKELQVTLKQEILSTEFEARPLERREPVDRRTQASESTVDYSGVRTTRTYDEAEVLTPGEIPYEYRALVKTYFRAVGPREKHDH